MDRRERMESRFKIVMPMADKQGKRVSVAAVFATMNRRDTALACVRALAAQTRPPELVVVADNVSNDDTPEALESLVDLPFKLIVLRMPENLGNAGGIRDAMDHAFFSHDIDAVWILDDDSWPRPEALAAMLDKPWNPSVVRHSVQIDPATGRFTWPLQIDDGGWTLVASLDDLPKTDPIKSRISWTGALVPRETRESTGPVNGELFIRGEDEEYPLRIERAGFSQEAVRDSILDHPGPADLVRWSFFGKNLFFEPDLADWKLYYKVRNMVWLKRTWSGNSQAARMAAAYLIAAAWIDGLQRFPLVIEAARDGWAGRLGKWKKHES